MVALIDLKKYNLKINTYEKFNFNNRFFCNYIN